MGQWNPDETYSPEPELSVEESEDRFILPEGERVTAESDQAKQMCSGCLRSLRSKYDQIFS